MSLPFPECNIKCIVELETNLLTFIFHFINQNSKHFIVPKNGAIVPDGTLTQNNRTAL